MTANVLAVRCPRSDSIRLIAGATSSQGRPPRKWWGPHVCFFGHPGGIARVLQGERSQMSPVIR